MADDPYVGRTAVNRQTGQRIMWMGSGKGWAPVDANNVQFSKRYAPEVQTAIENTQTQYSKVAPLVGMASEFQQLNRDQGTGGWFDHPGADGRSMSMMFAPQDQSARLQQMQALTNRMLRSQIVPGTSGTNNSVPEQAITRSTFPSIQNGGPANDAIVRDMKIDRDMQLERLDRLQKWAAQGGTDIGQFEREWAPYEQQRRARLRQYYQDNAIDLTKPLTADQARKLQPGTRFIGVDGVERVKH